MTDGLAPQQAGTSGSDAPGRASGLVQTLLRSEWPWMLYLAFAALLVVFSLASPWFLSVDNFLNIGRQTTLVSIVAAGMTFVIIAGQIDLSVASTLALSGMAAALAMAHVANYWFVGALAGLGTGALVGLINGALTTRLAIPSFLVTLGTLSAARGLAMMVTDTKPVIITNERYFRHLRRRRCVRPAGANCVDARGYRRWRAAASLQHLRTQDLRVRRQPDRGALFRHPDQTRYDLGLCADRCARRPSSAHPVGALARRASRRRPGHGARRHRLRHPRRMQPVRRAADLSWARCLAASSSARSTTDWSCLASPRRCSS